VQGDRTSVLIVSDIHYAGPSERERKQYELKAVGNPALRAVVKAYRHYIWMRDPFAHNHLLEKVLAHPQPVDWVIGNGDFSCDSAFVGMCDDAALESATLCLGALRRQFGERFLATIGDHELGKTSLFGAKGGMRLKSWERTERTLGIQPFWSIRAGRYVLMGIAATLVALPTYRGETLDDEFDDWAELRETHLKQITEAFAGLSPHDKVILFSHDPTALPYLLKEESVKNKVNQIERTVIGHLHSESVLWRSQTLSGMPRIQFMGNAINRMSAALNEARHWKAFNLLLCPALAGIELKKDGGYYSMELDPSGKVPAKFQFHPVPRSVPTQSPELIKSA
jgi:hypothetical protein